MHLGLDDGVLQWHTLPEVGRVVREERRDHVLEVIVGAERRAVQKDKGDTSGRG